MISDVCFRRFFRLMVLLTVTVLMTSQVSYGQGQAAPKVWSGGVMLDLSVFKNSTTQTSLSLGGKVIRAGQTWSHQFDGSHAFAEVSVPGFEQTVSDAQNLSSLSRRSITDKIFLLISPSYKRNAIQAVDYQFSEMVGIGFRPFGEGNRVTLNIVPIGGLLQQKKNIPEIDGNNLSGGVFESLTFQLGEGWTIDQSFLFLQNSKDSEDHRLNASITVSGTIVGPLGIEGSYSYDRENLVLEGIGVPADRRLSFGPSLRF